MMFSTAAHVSTFLPAVTFRHLLLSGTILLSTVLSGALADVCANCVAGNSWDGGIPLVNGRCSGFCSKYNRCGTESPYIYLGTDCRELSLTQPANTKVREHAHCLLLYTVILLSSKHIDRII